MAESYSVKAVLCAEDKNFSSMMKSCSSYAENLKNTLTSGIGFGAMAAIGSKAVSAVGSGLKSLTTGDRKSTRLNSSHTRPSRMPSSA